MLVPPNTTIQSQAFPLDTFWDVKAREKAEEEALAGEIRSIEAALSVVQKATALRHAPGFQDFVKALESMHQTARHGLENDLKLTDAGLRERRGYVRGLSDAISILTREGQTEQLAKQLQQRQNLLAEARSRRPQPRTEVTT